MPDLLNNDLAKTHNTLNKVLENNEYWFAIKLYDKDKQLIYPLTEKVLPSDTELTKLTQEIGFDDSIIGNLAIWIDLNAASAQRVDHIYHLERLLLGTLLLVALLAALLQNRWVSQPLRKLAIFASDIARRRI